MGKRKRAATPDRAKDTKQVPPTATKKAAPEIPKVGKFGTWATVEDAALCAAVAVYGARSWQFVSGFVIERTPKQCRERWLNHLQPGVNKAVFTPEEDRLLVCAVDAQGGKWAQISR